MEGMEQSPVSLLLHFASAAPLAVPGRLRTRAAMHSSPVIIDSDCDDQKNTEKTSEKTDVKEAEDEAAEPKFKCAICLGAYVRPTALIVCGHVFCASCIAKAFAIQKKCPTCGTRATKRALLQIYLS